MTEQELEAIRQRAEQATPGPWFWDTNRRHRSIMLKAHQNGGTCIMDFTRWGMHSAQPRINDNSDLFGGILRTMEEYDKSELDNPNADFIAHARQDIPALLAEVERLNEDKRELAGLLAKFTVSTIRLQAALENVKPYLARQGMLNDDGDARELWEQVSQGLKGGNS